jgi:hypothetical protein
MGCSLLKNVLLLLIPLLTGGCEYFSVLVKDDPFSKSYIEGILIDSLTIKPIDNIIVQLGEATVTTSDSGYFKLTNIPTGRQTISFSATGFTRKSMVANISLAYDSICRFLVLDLRPKVDSFIVTDVYEETVYKRLRLVLSDPDSNMNLFIVNWGDGNIENYPDNYNTPKTTILYAGHSYNNANVYNVIISAFDVNNEFTISSFSLPVMKKIKPEIGAIFFSPESLRPNVSDSLYLFVKVVNVKNYVKSIELNYNYYDSLSRHDSVLNVTRPAGVYPKIPSDVKYLIYPEGLIEQGGTTFKLTIPASILPYDTPPLDTNIFRITILDAEGRRTDTIVAIAKFPN